MSEYQYYEWQAIDRALTEEEVRQVGGLSSHMDVVTANQAVVTYQWGDFKHDPAQVLLRYFDAMLYWANWGSRRLMFRFPKGSIDPEQIQAYEIDEWITLRELGEYYLLDIAMLDEEPRDWDEQPDGLGPLAPLRQQTIEGDYRALYLAWLKAAEVGVGVFEDDCEPPVPAGLKELNGSLNAFAETFLQVNPRLLEVAAAASDPLQPVADGALAGSLAQLTPEECRAYLLRVLRNEPQVRAALRKQLSEMAGFQPAAPRACRSVAALLEEADRLEQEDQRRQQEEAERKRIRELSELARREDSLWREVEEQIERKQLKSYEQAVALLKRLRDLATYQHRLPAFTARVGEIRRRYVRLSSLVRLLDQAGL